MITQKQLARKIKDLRESRDWSQEELAKRISLSRVAISQLEVGKRSIQALELAKISKVFEVPVDFLLRNEQPILEEEANKNTKSKVSIKFNKEKLKNVILYLLEKCGGKPNIGETVLYKLLYFIDFDSYELYGEPVTGMRYVKLQYGPVPHARDYNLTVQEMIKNGELKIINQKYHNRLQKRYVALADADVSCLNPKELEMVNEVITKLSSLNANQIESYVHGDAPWEAVEDKQIIPYDLVIERKPPYAQRDYSDLWQNASGRDVLKDLGPMSKEEYDYYMNL